MAERTARRHCAHERRTPIGFNEHGDVIEQCSACKAKLIVRDEETARRRQGEERAGEFLAFDEVLGAEDRADRARLRARLEAERQRAAQQGRTESQDPKR
jgi:hypothetical protein